MPVFRSKTAFIRHLFETKVIDPTRLTKRQIAEEANKVLATLEPEVKEYLGEITFKDVDNSQARSRSQNARNQNGMGSNGSTHEPTRKYHRKMAMLSESELSGLAETIAAMRMQNPDPSLLSLFREAQATLPEHLRRSHVTTKREIERLRNRLITSLERIKYNSDQYELLRKEDLQRTDREANKEATEETGRETSNEGRTAEELLNEFSDEALLYYVMERRCSLTPLIPVLVEQVMARITPSQSKESNPVSQEHLNAFLPVVTEKVNEKVKEGIETTILPLVEKVNLQSQMVEAIFDHLTKPNETTMPFNRANTNFPNSFPPLPVESKQRLPRITVYGLKNNQIPFVEKACKEYANLRFIDKSLKNPRFSTNDDKVVLFVNFIDHSTEESAIATVGREKILRVKGGVATGIDEIIRASKQLLANGVGN